MKVTKDHEYYYIRKSGVLLAKLDRTETISTFKQLAKILGGRVWRQILT